MVVHEVAGGVHAEDAQFGAEPFGLVQVGQSGGGDAAGAGRGVGAEQGGLGGGAARAAPVEFGEVEQEVAAVGAERVERPDLGEPFGDGAAGPGALPEVEERGVGGVLLDPGGLGLADAVHVAEGEADAPPAGPLPVTGHQFDPVGGAGPVHVERQHGHPAPAGVGEQQPLGVHARVVGEQPGVEGGRVVGLEPGRLVGGDGEGDGVRLAEAVAAERLDDLPGTGDHLGGVAAGGGVLGEPDA